MSAFKSVNNGGKTERKTNLPPLVKFFQGFQNVKCILFVVTLCRYQNGEFQLIKYT